MRFTFLSESFYRKYHDCAEIEQKRDRPYIVTLVSIGTVTFAVPLRSHIKHTHVLWTDKENGCGLDFSKAVVLTEDKDIDTLRVPHIRQNEFDSLRGKDFEIKQGLLRYIRAYRKASQRLDVPRNRLLCQFSTLQYFEEYLHIVDDL